MSKKKTIGIAVGAAIVIIGGYFILRPGPSRSTDTSSTRFDSDEKKIEFLSKYLKLFSPIETAEFHVVYFDNSSGFMTVPGPSDFHIQAILKMSPSNLGPWVEGLELQPEKEDLSWGYSLVPKDDPRWKIKSPPRIYRRPHDDGVCVAVFEPEGVVFKSVDSF